MRRIPHPLRSSDAVSTAIERIVEKYFRDKEAVEARYSRPEHAEQKRQDMATITSDALEKVIDLVCKGRTPP